MSSKSAKYIIYPIIFSYVSALKGKKASCIKLGLRFSKERTRGKVMEGICKRTVLIKSHRIHAE